MKRPDAMVENIVQGRVKKSMMFWEVKSSKFVNRKRRLICDSYRLVHFGKDYIDSGSNTSPVIPQVVVGD
jgi:hypothetical protein